jgi:hypothetical protein
MFNVPRKLNQIGTARSFRVLNPAVNKLDAPSQGKRLIESLICQALRNLRQSSFAQFLQRNSEKPFYQGAGCLLAPA